MDRKNVFVKKLKIYFRIKRLALGKFIWDRKNNKINISEKNIIESNNIKSILFYRYGKKIGDEVTHTFVFREIKKKFPHIKIGVVSRGGATDIIRYNENIDKLYIYSKKRKDIKKLAKNISREKYDLLIDISKLLKVNNMMFINLCKAKINLGINRKDWKLFDVSLEEIKDKHHISKFYCDFLNKLGIEEIDTSYDISMSEKEKKIVKEIPKDYIVFNPYAASEQRSFNLENSIKISEILLKKSNKNLVLLGINEHRQELEKIKKKLGKRVIIPELKGILEVASIIENSKLVVTPDTSIVHIAVAYNKNIIAIYREDKENKNSVLWGPNSKKAKVIFVNDNVRTADEIDINKIDINKLDRFLGE